VLIRQPPIGESTEDRLVNMLLVARRTLPPNGLHLWGFHVFCLVRPDARIIWGESLSQRREEIAQLMRAIAAKAHDRLVETSRRAWRLQHRIYDRRAERFASAGLGDTCRLRRGDPRYHIAQGKFYDQIALQLVVLLLEVVDIVRAFRLRCGGCIAPCRDGGSRVSP
jgi:hypothetical protein